MKPILAIVGLAAAMVVATCSGQKPDDVVGQAYPYVPAFFDRQQMHLFPLTGIEGKMILPIILTGFAYGQDGRSLYGFDNAQTGLYKIEVEGMKLSDVSTSPIARGAFGVAVSPDATKVILSRTYAINGSRICGLFELRPQGEGLRLLVANPDCGPNKEPMAAALATWKKLSLSPDGAKVVASNKNGLVVIDLTTRAVQPVLGRFAVGAWSPDGKWLAVVEEAGERRTLLLDPKSLTEKRALGTSYAAWSPDSRYLLGAQEGLCGPYWSTFQVIDVESGKRLVVESSKCKVNLGTVGWIRKG